MAVFVSSDSGSDPTSTVRHSWRVEIFSEFGDDPVIRAHRQTVMYKNDTQEVVQRSPEVTITRKLSELPAGPRATVTALYGLTDQWEAEDAAAAAEAQ